MRTKILKKARKKCFILIESKRKDTDIIVYDENSAQHVRNIEEALEYRRKFILSYARRKYSHIQGKIIR